MKKSTEWKVNKPDQVSSYFKMEWKPLTIVTITGIVYNAGMTAGPYFEGQLVQKLYDILTEKAVFSDMVKLAVIYLLVIAVVQGARCLKRFYVRRFANDTSRNMRHMLYNSLVHKSKKELEQESLGSIMTKAVSDVDACTEGMRKFTTEVFDTGVVLIAYLVMLFYYDWKLTLLSCIFVPVAYLIAEKLKKRIYSYNQNYKKSAGRLNDATMDLVNNAVTYRVHGREADKKKEYDTYLSDYEKKAVLANLWENTLQPIYQIISMTGVVFIVYFGAKNIQGTGFTSWNIAAFTTYLSCFAKMSLKSSKAAKLFNAVQKAQVSWKRIKPWMKEYTRQEENMRMSPDEVTELTMEQVSFGYDGKTMISDLNLKVKAGELIGVTGPVASGKSSFGRLLLGELPYQGSIRIGNFDFKELSEYERSMLLSYMGHQPELMSDTIAENILLGETKELKPYLEEVCFEEDLSEMPQGVNTYTGNGGTQLSGGQQARIALARALYRDAKILVLDDPFSAVDKATEHLILKEMRAKSEGKMTIIISHRLDFFPECDGILWMDGTDTRFSDHEKLMKECNAYKKIYEKQMMGGDLDEI